MAMPTCVKCGKTSFELREATPSNSDYRVNFVQCSNCGGVIGVLDFYNIGDLILRLADRLNVKLES